MIRSYQPKDLPTIMDIGNRAWHEIYKMFREAYGDELFRHIIPNEATEKGGQVNIHCEKYPEWVYICEEGNRIVGFITFSLDRAKKIGEIGNNAVDPKCGIKGVGQQMYKAVFEYFREQNMLYVKVRTGLDYAHARARKAYERAGFNINHEDIDYYMKL